ncbi:cell division protein ZapE [Pseudahrensia aquimaris]|uniref:Cell division protein ZapE n=1 Tax=Pseudahrensia aquimaris TaxID=744461 RepID=A0ABW3FDZ7_9HYPH
MTNTDQSQSQTAAPTSQLSDEITALIATGELQADPAQRETIAALDSLLGQLSVRPRASKQGALGWLFGRNKPMDANTPQGLYIWGGVGRGKTMLMDLFFELAPVEDKRRIHFHGFMQDVHSRIHAFRQDAKRAKNQDADPIPPIAADLAKQARLLCFDEFAVTDVADAMILARLFTQLMDNGVTVVATSNVEPDNLYKDGLNRSWFLPFIELLKNRMHVLHLASQTDYRMEMLVNGDVYLTGNDRAAQFDALWQAMLGGAVETEIALSVKGRTLRFPRTSGAMLRASFDSLCREARGAGDYLTIAEHFRTIALEGVPVMDEADRNAAKRFIALIDTLYDAKRTLIVEAQARPSELYPVSHGTEAFEFDRTISRLREMQSSEWLAARRGEA